jgi:lipid-binding SYLF domain-containing protein
MLRINNNSGFITEGCIMKRFLRIAVWFVVFMTMILWGVSQQQALAATAAEIDRDVDSALLKLYEKTPAAKELAKVAKGILVFPDIVKGGLIIGGQYGEGALRIDGKTVGYYSSVAASYGLQAGVQSFGYALFFITDNALDYLKKSEGWEIGVGPSIVIVDEGVAKSLTTTTAKSDIYAFFFDQKGLMAGIGIQGSKITKVDK